MLCLVYIKTVIKQVSSMHWVHTESISPVYLGRVCPHVDVLIKDFASVSCFYVPTCTDIVPNLYIRLSMISVVVRLSSDHLPQSHLSLEGHE